MISGHHPTTSRTGQILVQDRLGLGGPSPKPEVEPVCWRLLVESSTVAPERWITNDESPVRRHGGACSLRHGVSQRSPDEYHTSTHRYAWRLHFRGSWVQSIGIPIKLLNQVPIRASRGRGYPSRVPEATLLPSESGPDMEHSGRLTPTKVYCRRLEFRCTGLLRHR